MKQILLMIAITASTAIASETYTVSFLLGTAATRPAGGTAWEPVMLFDRISPDDSIRCAAESRLELVDGDGSLITLNQAWQGPANPASLARFTAAADNRSLLKKLSAQRSSSVEQQPVAIAAVRGKTTGEDADETATDAATATATTDADDAATENDTRATARQLLNEAVALRQQVDRLLQNNNNAAAATTLQLAEKLTAQALTILNQQN